MKIQAEVSLVELASQLRRSYSTDGLGGRQVRCFETAKLMNLAADLIEKGVKIRSVKTPGRASHEALLLFERHFGRIRE